jgi:hypothetical protein
MLSRLRKLRRDEKGAAAVAMAIVSPILIGGMALGAETGYWYFTQRKLQHAADVAAHAAGVRKRVGDDQLMLEKAAVKVAAGSGFVPVEVEVPSPKVANLTVNTPPLSGSFAGQPQAVEVTLSETHPRMLSSIFSKEPVLIEARAVVKLAGGSPACVLALSETKPKAVEVSGSSSATLDGCSVASNSVQPDAYYMPNSTAHLTADCVSTVGGSAVKHPDGNVLDLKVCTDGVQENAPKTLDPYADVAEPAFTPSDCTVGVYKKPTYPIAPDQPGGVKCFTNLQLDGDIYFDPGVYIINGGKLTLHGGMIAGQDVTFFFANNATAELTGNPIISLFAPTTGPYAGILFFGARCDPSNPITCNEEFKITGSSGSTIQGAIYVPGSAINFLGNSTSSSSCLQIIADKVTFTGNSTINMGSSCSTAGTKDILVGQVVKLVE